MIIYYKLDYILDGMKVPTYPQILSSKGTDENERLSSVRSHLGPRIECQKGLGL